MRIAIDISQIIYETGVSTYTKNLVLNLLKIDKKNDYILFGGSLRRKGELKEKAKGIRSKIEKGNRKYEVKTYSYPPLLADLVWNRLKVFPVEKLVGDIDVLHSSDWAQPPTKAFKVTTVHDLVPIKYPELSDRKTVSVHKRRLEVVKKRVDKIIVPSKTTKKDLVDLGFNQNKIIVIPEAPDSIYEKTDEKKVDSFKKTYKIKNKYLLAIGVNPRKNTERIIKAFKKVKRKNLKLVIIGYPHMEVENQDNVMLLGHVPTYDLPTIYSGAEALIYPSLYEGFGLPILEAMACETAVVTSDLGSMKEVAGEAAVLVNPKDVDSIADGIKEAMKDSKKFVKKGKKRVKKFTWERVAKKTLKVYKKAK